jgi:spore coat polysaccharide biosynthesis protein SpsF
MAELWITAIIQARMSSSRLPGKVLLDIAGEPMLVRVVERTRLAQTVAEVLVATTTHSIDDAIVGLCRERSYPCYRGSEFDVLDRYYQAAQQSHAELVVRITADCPLIDPGVIDKTVQAFLEGGADFAANRLPPPWGRTYPVGLDTEVCSFTALQQAWVEADQPHQREHVMPFFYENPQRFKVAHINHDQDFGRLRWTVDTAEDLELVRQIFQRFPGRYDFSWLEVLELVRREPALAQINAQVQAKNYQQFDERSKSKL